MKRKFILIISLLLCASLLCPMIPVFASQGADQETGATITLRVGTYNIHNGGDVRHDYSIIAQDILDAGLDIVGLQEIDKNTSRNGGKDTPAILAEQTGYNVYYAPALNFDSGGQYGVAILSKYPILSATTTKLPGAGEQRVLAHAIIQVGDYEVSFYNTHLEWPNEDGRMEQLKYIGNLFKDESFAILTGDLNTPYPKEYAPSFPLCNFANGDADTFITNDEDGAIDNVVSTANRFIQTGSAMVETGHSDHNMLYADLVLLPEERFVFTDDGVQFVTDGQPAKGLTRIGHDELFFDLDTGYMATEAVEFEQEFREVEPFTACGKTFYRFVPEEEPVTYPIITTASGKDVTEKMTDGNITGYLDGDSHWYYEPSGIVWTVEQGVLEITGVGTIKPGEGFDRFADVIDTIVVAPQDPNWDFGENSQPILVTNVEDDAFAGLTNVTKAYIPENIFVAPGAFGDNANVDVFRIAAKTLTVEPVGYGIVNEDGKTLLKLTVKDGDNGLVLEEGQKIFVVYNDGEKKNEGKFVCSLIKYSETQPTIDGETVVFDICAPDGENQFIPQNEMTYVVNLYVINEDGSIAAFGATGQFAVQCRVEPIFEQRTSNYLQYSDENYLTVDLGEPKNLLSFGAAYYQGDSRYYKWQLYATNDVTLPLFAWDLIGVKQDKTPSNEGMYTIDVAGEYRYLRICTEYASSRWTALYTEIKVTYEQELTYDEDLWEVNDTEHWHVYNETGEEVPGTRDEHELLIIPDLVNGKKLYFCEVCGALAYEEDITYPIILTPGGEDVTEQMTDGDITNFIDGLSHWYYEPSGIVWTVEQGVLLISGVGDVDDFESFDYFADEIDTIIVAPQDPDWNFNENSREILIDKIECGAFAGLKNVTKAYIPENVTLEDGAFDAEANVTVYRSAEKTLSVEPIDDGIVNEDGKTLLKLTVKDGDNGLVLEEGQKIVVVYNDGEKRNEGAFVCSLIKYSETQPTIDGETLVFDICAPDGDNQFIPLYEMTYVVNLYVLNADGSIAAYGCTDQFEVKCQVEPIYEERTSKYLQYSDENFLIIDLGSEQELSYFGAAFAQYDRYYKWQLYGSNDFLIPFFAWDLLGTKEDTTVSTEGMYTISAEGSYRYLLIRCEYASSRWTALYSEIDVGIAEPLAYDENVWESDETEHWHIYEGTDTEVPGTREEHDTFVINNIEVGKKQTVCTVCGRVLSETDLVYPIILTAEGEDVTEQLTDGDITNYIDGKSHWYYESRDVYWTLEQGVLEIAGVGELEDLGFARFNDKIDTIIIAPQSANPEIRYGSDDGPFTGYTMTAIKAGAFAGLTNVKNAYIPEGIVIEEGAFDQDAEVAIHIVDKSNTTLTIDPAGAGFVNEDGKTLLKLVVKKGQDNLVLEEGQKIVVFYTDGEKKNEGNFYCTALKYSELQPTIEGDTLTFDICSPTDENQFIPHNEMTYIVNLYVLNEDGSIAAFGCSDQFEFKCNVEPIYTERTSQYIQYSPENFLVIAFAEETPIESFGAAYYQGDRYYKWQLYGTNDPTLPLFAWDLIGTKEDKTLSNEGVYTIWPEGASYRYLCIRTEYASSRWTALYSEIEINKAEKTVDEEDWATDETGHYHVYNETGAEVPGTREAHTASDWIVDSIATPEAAGHQHKECTVCGRVLEEEDVEYDPGEVSERWLCDENEHWHVYVGSGTEVPGTREAHTASDWIVDEEPGVGKTGTKHTECTVCGRVLETGTIPPTGDNTALYIFLAVSALALFGTAVVFTAKKSKKNS